MVTFSALIGSQTNVEVCNSRPGTPYEVLRDAIAAYLDAHAGSRLYVTGHSLGGALAVIWSGALLHDETPRV